jgi:hypothetical protein
MNLDAASILGSTPDFRGAPTRRTAAGDASVARKVIRKFGGQSALAALVGKRQSTVSYWAKAGTIPAKWQPRLLELARSRGINLTPSDFVEVSGRLDGAGKDSPLPRATHCGKLAIASGVVDCYVLNTGERIFDVTGIGPGLLGIENRAAFDGASLDSLHASWPLKLLPRDHEKGLLLRFAAHDAQSNEPSVGIKAERLNELLLAISNAVVEDIDRGKLSLDDRQRAIAANAVRVLQASSDLGLTALIDEATGYHYDRADETLKQRSRMLTEDELRRWEAAFPEQLWREFARLTHWEGLPEERPRHWRNLVLELVYDYLDPDVIRWLKDNAPRPMSGDNYHRWLTSQFGLCKLTEHAWMVVGMAAACRTMPELRRKTAERFGRTRIQTTFYVRASA